jgi:hypothetical protein
MRPTCSVTAAAAPVDVEVAFADSVPIGDPLAPALAPELALVVVLGLVAMGVLVPDADVLPLAVPLLLLLLPGVTTIPPSGPFEEGLLIVAALDASTNDWRVLPDLGLKIINRI